MTTPSNDPGGPRSARRLANRLRDERLARRWTLDDLADQIQDAAYKRGWDLQPDAHAIGRWERGERAPRRQARQLLCDVFGRTPAELGIGPRVEPGPGEEGVVTTDEGVVEILLSAERMRELIGEDFALPASDLLLVCRVKPRPRPEDDPPAPSSPTTGAGAAESTGAADSTKSVRSKSGRQRSRAGRP